MSPAELFRRVAALLVATGLLAISVASISADQGNEEAVVARTLKPTQVVAEIPEGYNELFEFQWGGGSLLHLKGRLATMGCMINTIWFYGNDQWNTYNQYNVPQDNPAIQQFKQQYEQFIPAGTLWANCYNVCEFFGETQCKPFEDIWAYRYGGIPKDTPCNDDFDVRVKAQVLPRMPQYPPTCIIKTIKPRFSNVGGYVYTASADIPVIVVYADVEPRNDEYLNVVWLKAEIHEICHTTQHWNWLQQLSPNTEHSVSYGPHFRESYGKEFIDLIGFVEKSPNNWSIPSDSIYKNLYHSSPTELSAELCSMYLLDAMGEPSNYEYERYVRSANGFIKLTQKRNFNISTYLTPEIREWLETYMILPDVSE